MDDRPIETIDRRRALAFAEGNQDAEKLEMTKIKLEQAENRELALTKFQKMVRDKKQEKADLKKRVEAEGKLSL